MSCWSCVPLLPMPWWAWHFTSVVFLHPSSQLVIKTYSQQKAAIGHLQFQANVSQYNSSLKADVLPISSKIFSHSRIIYRRLFSGHRLCKFQQFKYGKSKADPQNTEKRKKKATHSASRCTLRDHFERHCQLNQLSIRTRFSSATVMLIESIQDSQKWVIGRILSFFLTMTNFS